VLNKYLDQITDLLQNGFVLRRQACRVCEIALIAALQVFDPARLLLPARLVGLRRGIYNLELLPVSVIHYTERSQYRLLLCLVDGHLILHPYVVPVTLLLLLLVRIIGAGALNGEPSWGV
jgi:hypothetical protein